MNLQLSGQYVKIKYGDIISYGGDQRRDGSFSIRKGGCGVIAATDLFLYLKQQKTPAFTESPLSGDAYNALCHKIAEKYVPVIPALGTNAFPLCFGMNRLMKDSGINIRCTVKCYSDSFLSDVADMLSADFPVLFCIGKSLKGKGVPAYHLAGGSYVIHSNIRGHFAVITGITDSFLQISSWGEKLYLSTDELSCYASAPLQPLLTNYLYIS